MSQITVTEIADAIGRQPAEWEGDCYGIACEVAPMVGGEAVYGHYLGPVASTGFWSLQAGLPFFQHGWVLMPNGSVLDATRRSFEDVEPYVWRGPAQPDYDRGGNLWRRMMIGSPPQPAGNIITLNISDDCARHLSTMLGSEGEISAAEMLWLANASPETLGQFAHEFFAALVAVKLGGFIPADNRKEVLG